MGRRLTVNFPATKAIVNQFSSGGASVANIALGVHGIEVKNGVGTGTTLKSVLSVTGAGYVPYLICYSASATPTHTVRCQVLVDGVSVFDAISDTITTTSGRGFTVVDVIPTDPTYSVSTGVAVRFNQSFEVKVASSTSGTDYVAIRYEYQTTTF